MIHLIVEVANPAELLDPEAYDAGALLRWESSATIDGTYVEGGSEALLVDQFLYDIWDDAGTSTTWYRTRISDSGATTFSPYSEPFQPAQFLLSLAQFRALAPTSLSDESLLILLNAAASEIVQFAGPAGEITDQRRAPGDLLALAHTAGSITSVAENGVALTADDYALSSTGNTVRRLRTGTHPAHRWHGLVEVISVARDDLANRQRVQLELVKLSIAFQPGLASQTIGTWAEAYQSGGNGGKSYGEQRDELLASLASPLGVF